jgi:hypothetical protein
MSTASSAAGPSHGPDLPSTRQRKIAQFILQASVTPWSGLGKSQRSNPASTLQFSPTALPSGRLRGPGSHGSTASDQRLGHLNRDHPLSRKHGYPICTDTVRLWSILKWGGAENWVIQVRGTPLPNDNMAVSSQLTITNLYPRNWPFLWPCLHRQAVPRNAYRTYPSRSGSGPRLPRSDLPPAPHRATGLPRD